MKKYKVYSEEFKQDAVNYYNTSGKSSYECANDLKISQSTFSKWIKNAKANNGVLNLRGSGNYASDKDKEIAKLKKELKDHKDALDILKKAIGILKD
jgi:transposase